MLTKIKTRQSVLTISMAGVFKTRSLKRSLKTPINTDNKAW